MEGILSLGAVTSIIGVLVVLTNIIVQVIKKTTWDKVPTNIVAVVVSMVLTMASFIAYFQINKIAITWYLVFGVLVIGMMVAYAAMFGYDKLKEVLASIDSK